MVTIPRVVKARWWRFPITWWWRSLPLRVVLTVFLASVLVLVLGGFLLMQQATAGVLDGKMQTAKNEARQAVNTAQEQLNAADLTGDVEVNKLLLDLATGFANRAGQFEVIITSPSQTITAGNAAATSIPAALQDQVARSKDLLLITPTQINYRDRRPSGAGLAAGATWVLQGTSR
jgi:two-component system sensor histidine kinase MtrB